MGKHRDSLDPAATKRLGEESKSTTPRHTAPEDELSGISRMGPSWGSPSPLKNDTLGEPPYNFCSTGPPNICPNAHVGGAREGAGQRARESKLTIQQTGEADLHSVFNVDYTTA